MFSRILIKLLNKYDSIKQRYWNFLQSNQCVWERDTFFFLSSTVNNMSGKPENIKLGKSCKIRGELVVYPYSGKIIMGDSCYLGEGSRIWSESEIIIGNNVLIAHNVDVHDCNDHPIESHARAEHFKDICSVGFLSKYDLCAKPITIEDNVWVGFGASIMKGVKIEKNSIVAAHSVVLHDVPENSVVAGNPAQVIRMLAEK